MIGTHVFGMNNADDGGPVNPAKTKQSTAPKPRTDKEEQGIILSWPSFIKGVSLPVLKCCLIVKNYVWNERYLFLFVVPTIIGKKYL